MKKLAAILFLTAAAAFPQQRETFAQSASRGPLAPPASVTYAQIAPDCSGLGFLDQLSSGCFSPRIKVTVHPSSPSAVGVFVLVIYKSVMFNLPVVQPHFTTERDADGNFVVIFPSGDMSDITISAVEVKPGAFIVGAGPRD